MRFSFFIAAALLACQTVFLSMPALAAGQLADIQVYDPGRGIILATYMKDGRYYVAGEPGREYQIRVTNVSGQRLLAVVSVDGVNVLSGKTASPDQDGYVMNAGDGILDISGWRTSMERVAAFFFTRLRNSYAARTGRPNDVGAIGIALFRERSYSPPPPAPCCWPFGSSRDESPMMEKDAPAAKSEARAQDSESASAGNLAKAAPGVAEKKIGTGYGRSEYSRVIYTDFERASSTPDEIVTLYYDSHQRLVAQGVIPDCDDDVRHPNPFPAGFVPPPPA